MVKKRLTQSPQKLAKSSKIYAAGPEAEEKMIELRARGTTYQDITDYLNIHYKHKLTHGVSFKLSNIFSYFQVRGKHKVEIIERQAAEAISRRISSSGNLTSLLDYLTNMLEYYKEKEERMKLKDTINAIIKIYELQAKLASKTEGDKHADKVNVFLAEITKEFAAPRVTKEVIMDEYGKVVGAKIKKTERIKDDNIQSKNEEDKDYVIIEDQKKEKEAIASDSC